MYTSNAYYKLSMGTTQVLVIVLIPKPLIIVTLPFHLFTEFSLANIILPTHQLELLVFVCIV